MSDTRITSCSCKHEEQDKMYGKQQRVFNKKKDGKWRCSVCKTEKS